MEKIMARKRLLLTGVFGPFGVKTKYAESLGMQMELLNNQITRMQGVHSPRQSYWTFPLYLIAENISVETTVLDFPKWSDFIKELKKGYTHVGINFIVANVLKAQRMAKYIRENYPDIKIILGGYGTIIPELKEMVPYDAACNGEGVRWTREYFGEDPNAPIKHPAMFAASYSYFYGARGPISGAILMPGVGCENGCKFCITSAQFKKQYYPLLPTGKDIFEVCNRVEAEIKQKNFTILDENFLKQPTRATELLDLMTINKKPYVFGIFSSAEVIKKMGVDFLVRMGVTMIWVGVESKNSIFDKTKGINMQELFTELQNNGISVNASTMLFQDHHDEKTIRDDIDYVISLNSDFIQFMNYTPLPGTALYAELNEEKRLKYLPWRYVTGAGELYQKHPYINDRKKHAAYLKNAFKKKYLVGGPGSLNLAITALKGYKKALDNYTTREAQGLVWNPTTLKYEKSANPTPDEFMKVRIKVMRKVASNVRLIVLPAWFFAPNKKVRKKAAEALKLYNEILGKPDFKQRALSMVLILTGMIETVRILFSKIIGREGVVHQPKSLTTRYPEKACAVVEKVA
jgi:hypothetical protein